MELNETAKKAYFISDKLLDFFGKRVGSIVIEDIVDVPGHTSFDIKFKVYDYFPMRFNYDTGRFGCSIAIGETAIGLENSQKWWDSADFDIFFEELKQEIELRIPDKFLKAKGWL